MIVAALIMYPVHDPNEQVGPTEPKGNPRLVTVRLLNSSDISLNVFLTQPNEVLQ